MLPLVLLLVLNDEVVLHNNQVTIVLSVLQGNSKDVAEDIEAGSSLTLSVVHFQSSAAVKELEEVHSLNNFTQSLILKDAVSAMLHKVSTSKNSFDNEARLSLHTGGQLVTK